LTNALAGAFFLLFGVFLLLYRGRLSRHAIEDWSRAFPRVKIWKSAYDGFALICGLAFVAVGIMMLLGIIQRR
jgi:hypothetical protein